MTEVINRLKIGTKLTVGFLLVILIFSIGIGITWWQMQKISISFDVMELSGNSAIEVEKMAKLIRGKVVRAYDYMLYGEKTSVEQFKELRLRFNELEKVIKIKMDTQEEIKLFNTIKEKDNRFNELFLNKLVPSVTNGYEEEAEKIKRDLINLRKEIDNDLDQLNTILEEDFQNSYKTGGKLIVFSVSILLGVLAISILLGIGISYYLSKLITKPVNQISKITKEIADGNLKVEKVSLDSKDELGQLADNVDKMLNNLRKLIRANNETAEEVAASSEELLASTEQTTKVSTQIASSIQEVASGADKQLEGSEDIVKAMEEMVTGIQKMVEISGNVSEDSNKTAREADDGNKSIKNAVNQMKNINNRVSELSEVIRELGERSQEIGQIVEVITGIASQTNLLALNAAIEAARAGENGRGFAVVADEIRELAEQSGESAQQISNLIAGIQKDTNRSVDSMEEVTGEVKSGLGIVNKAGQIFGQIVNLSRGVAEQVEEVSAFTEEMSANSQEILALIEESKSIAEKAASSSQNVAAASEEQSASMEEITASADRLSQIAQELEEQIDEFNV